MTNPYDKGATLEAKVVRCEVISAQAFLALKEASPADIKSSRPVGPSLGKPGFGGIEVTYNTPKYRVA
jgi:hypothetical protein